MLEYSFAPSSGTLLLVTQFSCSLNPIPFLWAFVSLCRHLYCFIYHIGIIVSRGCEQCLLRLLREKAERVRDLASLGLGGLTGLHDGSPRGSEESPGRRVLGGYECVDTNKRQPAVKNTAAKGRWAFQDTTREVSGGHVLLDHSDQWSVATQPPGGVQRLC